MLNEICDLAINLNINIKKKKIAKIKKIIPSTLLGKGLLEEISDHIKKLKINLLICNCPLSPAQQKNLEDFLKIKVTDRVGIIIEIFAKRALSNEGKLQVELAELTYRKSRLVRAWTHLERQRGGTTFIGGPGELQIELDRRLIQEKINKIKKKLKNVSKRRSLQRKLRRKNNFKTFALVGYTNVGKTLLFNKLTKSKQSSKNKLFETLDTKISKIYFDRSKFVGLIDTVGFIKNIPTELIESFKATLEEINQSDYIINVVDSNDVNFKDKIKNTINILKETGASDKKINDIITVFNKIDINNRNYANADKNAYVSALTGKGISNLKEIMQEKLTYA